MSTKIEWTDLTTNPIRARYAPTKGDGHYCEKIAPECARCYASRMQPRFGMPQFDIQRRVNIEHYFAESHLAKVLDRKKPAKIFWCDMSDMFGEWVPDEWIDRCFAVMALTPHHTHQVLTKRPERMRDYMTAPIGFSLRREGRVRTTAYDVLMPDGHRPATPLQFSWPLPNVWLGTSAGTQKSVDTWIPELLSTPAAVRFVSVEPLLEDVDLTPHLLGDTLAAAGPSGFRPGPKLDWVIVGGESGQSARHTEIAHIRSVVQQCTEAGIPVFVKQMGSRAEDIPNHISYLDSPTKKPDGFYRHLNDSKGGDPSEWTDDLCLRQFPKVAP